jgi:hypothetical protein
MIKLLRINKMAQTRSIFMIENYSDRGIPQGDPPLKFINCPKIEPWDFLLLVPELRWDLTTIGGQRYHLKNRSLNELDIKIIRLR